MKFPFLSSSKADSKSTEATLTTPPRMSPKNLDGVQAAPALVPDFHDALAIPLSIKSILSQLPTQLIQNADSVANTIIALPPNIVLPQLATGKVVIQLSDLIPLLPQTMLKNPLSEDPATQTITLPLAELIASVPPELLSLKHENSIQVDTTEFNSLPELFEEPQLASSGTETPVEPFAEENIESPAFAEVAHPALLNEIPSHVQVSLRAVVASLPDEVLAGPRSELWRNTDPALPVLLPVKPILPQLRSAKVLLPLTTVLEAVPQILLIDPLPNLDGRQISIPLAEIISQLPPRLFNERVGEVGENLPEIPEPFVEEQPAANQPEQQTAVEPLVESIVETTSEASAPQTGEEIPAPKTEPAEGSSRFDSERFLVNINRCTVEDLRKIPGIGPSMAQRIVDFRNARGQFASIQDLKRVPGVGRKTFRALTGFEPCLLNSLLGVEHDNELSLQEIVRLASQLTGVAGCILAMADGLFLTGELPAGLDKNSISVFAPQLFRKLGRYMRELRIGQIRRFTIFTDQLPLSIFRAGEIYLIVIHDQKRFSKALLRRCERISDEIARLCRQRAVV